MLYTEVLGALTARSAATFAHFTAGKKVQLCKPIRVLGLNVEVVFSNVLVTLAPAAQNCIMLVIY